MLPTNMQIKARLQGLMDQRGLIQQQLADRMGVSRVTIFRRFGRDGTITIDEAVKMATAIMAGEGDPETLDKRVQDTLLGGPVVSPEMQRVLEGVHANRGDLAERRIAMLEAEGLIERNAAGCRLTQAGLTAFAFQPAEESPAASTHETP
jgi:transcriptional regulator with XRE-family HTH domain